MERDSVLFYRSFYDAVSTLPEKEQGKAMMEIMRYIFEGIEPGKKSAVFILAKPQIDAMNERYENACKGAGFGKLGGRPRKEKPYGVSENDENENPIGFPNDEKTKPHRVLKNAENKTLKDKGIMINDIERESIKRETQPACPDFESLLAGTGLSDQAKAAVRDWVSYKQNKGSPYVQQSFIAFLNRTAQAIAQYGEEKVLWCIGESLSNGWNNIRWEKLDEPTVSAKDAKAGHSQERHTDYNAMVMQELAECMG